VDDFLPYFDASPNQAYLLQRLKKELDRHKIEEAKPEQYAEVMNMLSQFYKEAIDLHCKAKQYRSHQGELDGHDVAFPADEAPNEAYLIEVETAFNRYIYERNNANNWSEKTRVETISVFKKLREVYGNVPLCTLNRTKARQFKDTLLNLPPNLSTIRERDFKDKPLAEISQIDHPRKLSPKTVNKMLTFLRSFFSWCVDGAYCEENIFKDIRAMEPRALANEERDHCPSSNDLRIDCRIL